MAKANKTSYKTCYVFRIDDHKEQESRWLMHDGEWDLIAVKDSMVKCFDIESAEAVASLIRENLIRRMTVEVVIEEVEVDLLMTLGLYPFVKIMLDDLRVLGRPW